MSIVNRRNAVVGWLTITVGRRFVRQKTSGRSRRAAAALVAASVAGALVFWRRRSAAPTDAE